MMTDEQSSRVAELKAAIAATASAPSGAPAEVREAVVALKKELQRGGTTARVLAAALAVHESTLCRWEREVRTSPRGKPVTGVRVGRPRATGARASGFRAVQIVAPEASAATSTAATISHGLRVAHAPSGLVVDGLDVEALVVLLKRMS